MARIPFDDILNTNVVPSDAECQRIHDLLAGPRKDLSDLMGEIARIQAELDQLTKKRVDLEDFIHAHEALLSPMRRLPDDTLRDLFLASLPCGRCATLSAVDPPLLLCHICQRWRRLALSTPGLWASLHIALPPIDDSRTAQSPKLREIDDAVQAWLSRSGSLPISISFVVHGSGSGHYPIQQLLDVFTQHSRRWKSIRFDFPTHNLLAGFEALSPADVPLLRSAIISGFESTRLGGFSSKAEGRPYLSFLGAPTLDSLSILHGNYDSLVVRWDALQHVSFQMIGLWADRALELLRQCPALETCTLFIDTFPPRSDAVVSQPCHLPHLKRLSVMDIGLMTEFFQYLVIPNLRCLEYTYWGRATSPGLLPCFFILPSASCLESLHLRVNTMTTDALAAGLRLVPTLRELRLSGEPPILNTGSKFPEYDPGLIPLLTPNSTTLEDAVLCPHLQHITLLRFSAMTDAALLAFLLARTDPSLPTGTRLTSARVHISRPPDTDSNITFTPTLQQRMADGLQLSLEYRVSPREQLPRSSFPISRTSANQDDSHDWDPVHTSWV
ncbi:hypothetical protein MSAN_00311600 [Mycena sanguinolenta]|uniref:F-box domain-containing protein n=1 Tax=Mycena sanguinolenta TaxID=230812 RepID=A0A8H6ZER0_9AGAR|nr:hypothetical protein MSAN_00311600 [Mycena sanguinolenta]